MSDNPFDKYPKVDFMPLDVASIKDDMYADYEKAYKEATGKTIKIQPASEARLHLNVDAYHFGLAYQKINWAFKQNQLKYATGVYLEGLGAWFGIEREGSQSSYTEVEFKLSKPQNTAIPIMAGTRVSTSKNIYFEVIEQTTIPANQLTAIANVRSLQTGEDVNGIGIGEINILVDPIPFVDSVRNTKETQGGASIESDERLRLRIYYAPDGYSTAGPIESYTYFTLEFSQSIKNVKVTTPAPGQVDIRVMLQNDVLPDKPFLDALYKHLSERTKRPLTDFLNVAAPDIVNYKIDFKYYIANSNYDDVSEIQKKVDTAVNDYILWQESAIGRDVTPDVLIRNLIIAGVKRVEIKLPIFTPIEKTSIAKLEGSTVIEYGGIEDD